MSAIPFTGYETILKYAPVGMRVSEKRVIRASNVALARTFGYESEHLYEGSFSKLYPTSKCGPWPLHLDISGYQHPHHPRAHRAHEIAALLVEDKTGECQGDNRPGNFLESSHD